MRAVLLVLMVACWAAPAVAARDRTPPAFAGLKAATTCIPGPIGERMSRYRLVWPAAKDALTPQSRMRYDIYRAAAPGRENFVAPTYTVRGTTLFMTPPLSSAETYYFVVRARDAAGNRDRNRRERAGENLCE
jgi:hypothetical protein